MLGEASSRAKGLLAPVMTAVAKELDTGLTSRAANKWCSCLCAGEKNRRIKCLLAESDRMKKVLRLVKMLPAHAMKVILKFDKMDKWFQNAIAKLPMKALQIPSPTLLPRCQLLAQTRLLQSENKSPKSDLEAARDSHDSWVSPSPVQSRARAREGGGS